MKSKLNKHRGFTIAEIIIAVAIMATLIAVLMNGLKASRASIKRDTYQAELIKRAMTVGAKAEAYVFEHGSLTNFKPDSGDLKDPVNGTYSVTPIDRTSTQPYKIKVDPENDGILKGLGVKGFEYTFD